MTWPGMALQGAYFAVLSLLALYGLHRLFLVGLFLRRRRPAGSTAAPARLAAAGSPPAVTVQLPLYNERYVLERLIDAACALRYPAGLLEIQVLDDSDDGSSVRVAELVASYRARGADIHHLRRSHRRGYKAGALAAGLARARGELIAIFDADFVPPPGFLERTVPRFCRLAPGVDPDGAARLGMLQARWGHLNRDESLLTRAQALLLDGHFVVEHAARSTSGRFLNFNGTAGIFRRACIEQAGGWHSDTLTEDLDLSYRAQLAGWRFDYLPDLEVPAELPVELNALRSQQRRWTRGSIQTLSKLAGRILGARIPVPVKIEALFHLSNNAAWLLLAILAVLIVPALEARGPGWGWLALDLPLFAMGTGSFGLFCAVAQRELERTWWRTLAEIPVMMMLGAGLCLNNAHAVLGALRGGSAEFQRTPKFGRGAGPGGTWARLAYRGPRSALVLLEALFAAHFVAAVASAAAQGRWAAIPFLALFALGFSYVTCVGIGQELRRLIIRASGPPAAAPAP